MGSTIGRKRAASSELQAASCKQRSASSVRGRSHITGQRLHIASFANFGIFLWRQVPRASGAAKCHLHQVLFASISDFGILFWRQVSLAPTAAGARCYLHQKRLHGGVIPSPSSCVKRAASSDLQAAICKQRYASSDLQAAIYKQKSASITRRAPVPTHPKS